MEQITEIVSNDYVREVKKAENVVGFEISSNKLEALMDALQKEERPIDPDIAEKLFGDDVLSYVVDVRDIQILVDYKKDENHGDNRIKTVNTYDVERIGINYKNDGYYSLRLTSDEHKLLSHILKDAIEKIGGLESTRPVVRYEVTNGQLKALRTALKEAVNQSIWLAGTDKVDKLFADDVTDFIIEIKSTSIIVEDEDGKFKTVNGDEVECVIVHYESREFYEMDLSTYDYKRLRMPFSEAIRAIGGVNTLRCI